MLMNKCPKCGADTINGGGGSIMDLRYCERSSKLVEFCDGVKR